MIEFEKTVLYRDLGFFLHYCGCFFKDVTAVSCSASMPYEENAAFLRVLFFVFYCIKMLLLSIPAGVGTVLCLCKLLPVRFSLMRGLLFFRVL